MPGKEAARKAAVHIPQGSLLIGALVASMPTLILLIPLNVRVMPPTGIPGLFAVLYAVGLPLALYTGYISARALQVLREEGCSNVPPLSPLLGVAIAAVPLGIIVPLYMLGSGLSRCGLKQAQRLSTGGIDIFLNLITLGLHSVLYAALLERILSSLFEENKAL